MSFVHRFEGLTLAAVLANRATSDPNGSYLRYRQDVLTFGQVESQADQQTIDHGPHRRERSCPGV